MATEHASERILLTIGWTSLRSRDLQLFATPTGWLNDDCINFYYEYLGTKTKDNLVLVAAATAALIVYESAENLGAILEELHLAEHRYWLIPVNDKRDPAAAGGMHWSLLFYDGEQKVFYHLDSKTMSCNYENARFVAQKLSKLYGLPYKLIQSADYAMQDNCYDCGMYVLACSEKLVLDIMEGKKDLTVGLKEFLTPEYVAKRRKEIYQLFVELIKEKSATKK